MYYLILYFYLYIIFMFMGNDINVCVKKKILNVFELIKKDLFILMCIDCL